MKMAVSRGFKDAQGQIDPASDNFYLRDPVIYRIACAAPAQGNAWCIYPMYDYAHPIQDALRALPTAL